jgi:hypothetical protein
MAEINGNNNAVDKFVRLPSLDFLKYLSLVAVSLSILVNVISTVILIVKAFSSAESGLIFNTLFCNLLIVLMVNFFGLIAVMRAQSNLLFAYAIVLITFIVVSLQSGGLNIGTNRQVGVVYFRTLDIFISVLVLTFGHGLRAENQGSKESFGNVA